MPAAVDRAVFALLREPKGESAETLALMRRIDELFLILFLKSNRFANRMFTDVAALKEACWSGWQWLTD